MAHSTTWAIWGSTGRMASGTLASSRFMAATTSRGDMVSSSIVFGFRVSVVILSRFKLICMAPFRALRRWRAGPRRDGTARDGLGKMGKNRGPPHM